MPDLPDDIILPVLIPTDYPNRLPLVRVPTPVELRRPWSLVFFNIFNGDPIGMRLIEYQQRQDREGKRLPPLFYSVEPTLMSSALSKHIRDFQLRLCLTRQGGFFFWPIKSENHSRTWDLSISQAIDLGLKSWIRCSKSENKAAGYDIRKLPLEPDFKWPALDIEELLTLAFTDRFINSLDHSVARDLLRRKKS